MLTQNNKDEQRRRHDSFSINPTISKSSTSRDPGALLKTANTIIAASIVLLLVGLLPLLIPADALSSVDHRGPIYLRFPNSFLFFLPLLIPLTTYIVIARWTGEKHYRHS